MNGEETPYSNGYLSGVFSEREEINLCKDGLKALAKISGIDIVELCGMAEEYINGSTSYESIIREAIREIIEEVR